MQRRSGGGGFGGGGNAQAAKHFLLSLFGDALGGRGPGGRGGAAGGRGGGRQPFGPWQREGEWECQCGFATNRPYRESCFSCNRSRDVAEVGGGGSARRWKGDGGKGQSGKLAASVGGGSRWAHGPVGAGGSRPLLGQRGQLQIERSAKGGKGDTRAAPWNGKGPAYSAAGGEVGGAGQKGDPGGKGSTKGKSSQGHTAAKGTGCTDDKVTWERPSAVFDGDGFKLVQPRKVRVTAAGKGQGADATTRSVGEGSKGGANIASRRLWSDEDSVDDVADDDGDDGAGGEAGAEEGEAEEPDPSQLRAVYEQHARAVRDLERRGGFDQALDTMRLARDEAERKWREAKAPAPLPKRLMWAEAKLQRAQTALTRARLQLDQFDEETDKRRAAYCDRIQEAERWYKWRQEQLNDIHEEAAGRAHGGHGGDQSGGGDDAGRKQIRGQVLPEIQAILEELQEGTTLHGRLALVVAGLADAEAKIGKGYGNDGATRYHMYDGDSQDEYWDEYDQGQPTGAEGDHQGGEPTGSQPGANAAGWRPEGPGRWTRAGNSNGGKQQQQKTSDGTESTRDLGSTDAARGATGGKTTTGTSGGHKGSDHSTQDDANDDDEASARSAKHRRRQAETETSDEARRASDAVRAQELREQLQRASAAQEQSFLEGTGGFGSEVALSWAAQKFVLDVQRAQAQAGEMGIEPRAADGRALLELFPMELKQWIEENLEGDDMRD